MQAVEFKTIIQDGIIKMPGVEELISGTEVKVIAMWAEKAEPQSTIEHLTTSLDTEEIYNFSFVPGSAQVDEKPSDFAGIWKNRKEIDAKKLRQRAWARSK